MSFWQKTMLWLGLGPDEMYEGMSDGVHSRKWPNEQNESEISTPKSSKTPIKARLIENFTEQPSSEQNQPVLSDRSEQHALLNQKPRSLKALMK